MADASRRALAALALVVPVAFYAGATWLAAGLVASANAVSQTYTELSRERSVESKTDRLVDEVLSAITLGLYRGDDPERAARIRRALADAAAHERRADRLAWTLLGVSVAFVAAVAALARARGAPAGAVPAHLLGVGAVFLAVGLLAPMLTVEARGEVAVLGEVVLHHESRGILATVDKLWHTDNRFVAALLALFSAVVPVLKLGLSAAALAPVPARVRAAALRVIAFIGRWSMTDVFVVAILLAFLAADGQQLTDARLGPGLYFFAGYGVLSLAAGHALAARAAA